MIAVEEGWREVIIADRGAWVGPRALDVGDIDGDSLAEIVAGFMTLYGPQLYYYELVDDQWVATLLAEDFMSIKSVTIGNLDDDADNEILIGGTGIEMANSELCYFEFVSNEWVIQNITNPDQVILATAIGDLDNDGVNEVAVGYGQIAGGYELRYYEFNGGSWTEFNVDDDLGESDGIQIADVDKDDENELIYLGGSLNQDALCYYDYNEGAWTKTTIPCWSGWEIDAGDVDNDGDIEIAWGNFYQPENEVRIYDNIAGIWTEVNVSDMNACAEGTGIYHVEIGDVDNDELNELVIGAERVLYQIRYFEYVDDTWIGYNISSTPFSAQVVKIADIDYDNKNEIVVGLSSYETTSDEIRYYERIEDSTTETTSLTPTTNSTTGSGQIDPMILAVGIAIPLAVILLVAVLKFKKKS